MTEKRKAHHPLDQIKADFADLAKLNRTFSAAQGASNLGMDDAAVIAVIQGLAVADFDKSMTSHQDHTIWQDVYKPRINGTELYVKFTLDAQGQFLLISFKEA